ncbi:hypothetical protein F5884DRAFT_749766 [Xylogone sp. PMI_703]|nr:hypothetical protein F5884DRAFT_749766 [Xylogone sp. PMI_703]
MGSTSESPCRHLREHVQSHQIWISISFRASSILFAVIQFDLFVFLFITTRINLLTNIATSSKKLNVESPSFTPAGLPGKTGVISSQAAAAAPFTPRSLVSGKFNPSTRSNTFLTRFLGTSTPNTQDSESSIFNPAQIREFTPHAYDLSQNTVTNGATDLQHGYDPFTMSTVTPALPSAQYNPYLEDNSNISSSAAYYASQNAYTAPIQPVGLLLLRLCLQYHLYAPLGPHREDLLAYQRMAHDFFMSEKLREDLQRKSEATLQVMPNSQLPTLDNYHTLVALDTNHHKNAAVFGYQSWVYKATSSKNGKFYCLRRLEGYRLTNENAIRSVKEWRRVDSGGVVTVHDAFTTRAFGDSSLIFVTDYHPLSKTLVESHFTNTNRYGNRGSTAVPEQVLWGYVVQIASAIKIVHGAGLAVRCMDASKILLTDKNRIRLNGCSVLDVVQFEAQRPLQELQQEDFKLFGKLMLSIATNTLSSNVTVKAQLDQLNRAYSQEFRDTVIWLITPAQTGVLKNISEFLAGISDHVATSLDSALHSQDTLTSELSRELENGRIARLMMKLGTINERQEYDGDRAWSENGERYMLKLFRDYVFHQVDAEGRPVVDLGHMIRCLNKLDAGIDEKVLLTSRDEQTTFVVTYKELKKQVAAAFGDLTKGGKARAF